jgi:nitroreductase
MDCLTALVTRASPVELRDPAPSGEALDGIISAALRAPDHGLLRPWRFILIRGAARDRFGQLLASSLGRREPASAKVLLEREQAKPLRAPLIIVVAATPKLNHKVPEIEQIVSAGAAAQNILVAAHALGFGGFWRTGAAAYDTTVKAGLGLRAEDVIVGFLYLGTVARPALPRRKLETNQFVFEERINC